MPLSTLFIGIDVSLDKNQVCAINFNKDRFFNKSYDNSPIGAKKLTSDILDLLNKHKELSKVSIAMESTNVYHIHVSSILSQDKRLRPYRLRVYVINATLIANYKKSLEEPGKDDPTDAYVIADYIRVGKGKDSQIVLSNQKLALQRLTRQRKHIAEQLGKEKQYLSSNLYLKLSALKVNGEEAPFSNIYGKTAMDIFTEFLTNEEIINTDLEDLVKMIIRSSKGRFSDPDMVAKLLKRAASKSYTLDKTSSGSITQAIASSFRIIKTYQKEMKELDKAIIDLIGTLDNKYYDILVSIPGIGQVFAAGIIAEINDIYLFRHNKAFASYCGLRWKKNDSGRKFSEHTKQPNMANKYLRYYVIEATASVINRVDSFSVYFYSKKSEVKINAYKRALVLTARKFVRVIFGLLRENKLFDERHLIVNK